MSAVWRNVSRKSVQSSGMSLKRTRALPADCCAFNHSGSTSIHGSGTRPCTRRCISTSASCMSTADASSGCVVFSSLSSATSRVSARCGRGGRSFTLRLYRAGRAGGAGWAGGSGRKGIGSRWLPRVEAADGFLLRVVEIERRGKTRDSQQIAHALGDVDEFELAAALLDRQVRAREAAEIGAVDIRNVLQVEQEPRVSLLRERPDHWLQPVVAAQASPARRVEDDDVAANAGGEGIRRHGL